MCPANVVQVRKLNECNRYPVEIEPTGQDANKAKDHVNNSKATTSSEFGRKHGGAGFSCIYVTIRFGPDDRQQHGKNRA